MKLLILSLLPSLALGLTVTATSATPTQAVLSFNCSSTPSFIVSESNTLSPPVHDVDAANYFLGSNLGTRPGVLVDGSGNYIVVIGKRALDTADATPNVGKIVSRALQQGTTHYGSLTCGIVTATFSFTTKILPYGSTYSDLFPVNSDGSYRFPSWDMTNRAETMVDAQRGTLIRHINLDADGADTTSKCNSPNMGLCFPRPSDSGLGYFCSDTVSAQGNYHCIFPTNDAGFPSFMYGINPTTGVAVYLGHAYFSYLDVDPLGGNFGSVSGNADVISFLPGNSNVVFFGAQTTAFTILTSNINNSTTTIPVTSAAEFVIGTNISIDSESMLITGVSGLNISVLRGTLGTIPASHNILDGGGNPNPLHINRQTIVKWEYNGNDAPGGLAIFGGQPNVASYVGINGGGLTTGMDMLSGGDLNILAKTFNSNFDNTVFACSGASAFFQANYMQIGCRSGEQGSFNWDAVYSLGNQSPLGSGGNGTLAGMIQVYALPACRWCTDHTVEIGAPGTTILLDSMGYAAGSGVGKGPNQIVLGTNMPANSTPITVSVSSLSLVGTHNASCTDTWTTPPSPYVDGEPVSPCSPHFFQIAAVGDLLEAPNGEFFQVTGKGTGTLTLSRGQHGTPLQSHSIGDILIYQCQAYESNIFQGVAFAYWNFVSSPNGTEHPGDLELGVGGHSAYRLNHYVEGQSAGYGYFPNPVTNQSVWGNNYPDAVTGTTFSGVNFQVIAYQRHPSIANGIDTSFYDSTFFGGLFPSMSTNNNSATALVPPYSSVWSYQSSGGVTGISPKIMPQIAATCGSPPGLGGCISQQLVDVSAPGKVLTDSDPDYSVCFPWNDNECASGSTGIPNGGTLAYFKMSTFDHANGWCQGTEGTIEANQNICIGNLSASGIAQMQYKFINDSIGTQTYRPLTRMWGSYNGMPGTLKLTQMGEWLIYWAQQNETAGTSNVVAVKVPSDPTPDGIDRGNFIPATLSLTPPGGMGIDHAKVEFWYVEQGGSSSTPYCTSRREGCVTVANAPINPATPFYYSTTDTYSPLACSTSCTIAVPVLPEKTAYFSVKYIASGTVVATCQGEAQEATVTALPSCVAPLTSTTTAITSSLNPSTFGANVTFTATVTSSAATGTVSVYDSASLIGTGTLSGGSTTVSTSLLTVGSHTITAVYGGDSTYAGSTSPPLTQVVTSGGATPSLYKGGVLHGIFH